MIMVDRGGLGSPNRLQGRRPDLLAEDGAPGHQGLCTGKPPKTVGGRKCQRLPFGPGRS